MEAKLFQQIKHQQEAYSKEWISRK